VTDSAELLRRIRTLTDENKEQAQRIAHLRGVIKTLIDENKTMREPPRVPYMPCVVCRDTGRTHEWAEDAPGVIEVDCPKGCLTKEDNSE
jgi:hypothetical protein